MRAFRRFIKLQSLATSSLIQGICIACMVVSGCERRTEIDFEQRNAVQTVTARNAKPSNQVRIAIASILSADQSFAKYQELLNYVCARCSLSARMIYCKDYADAYRLIESHDVDAALVCTALYAIARRKGLIELLVVPVVDGRNTYRAAIIVPESSPARTFEQLRGKRFAFTDRLSLTGYFYPLSRCDGETGFWGETIFTGSHDKAVDLVSSGLVDGASVDRLVLEDLLRRIPRLAGSIRILEESAEFGMPPVVVSTHVDRRMADVLRESFLTLANDSLGRILLGQTGIERFETVHDTLYASVYKLVPESVTP